MRSKHLITITAVAFSGIVCAQMPVPLLDNEPATPNAALWAVEGTGGSPAGHLHGAEARTTARADCGST